MSFLGDAPSTMIIDLLNANGKVYTIEIQDTEL